MATLRVEHVAPARTRRRRIYAFRNNTLPLPRCETDHVHVAVLSSGDDSGEVGPLVAHQGDALILGKLDRLRRVIGEPNETVVGQTPRREVSLLAVLRRLAVLQVELAQILP